MFFAGQSQRVWKFIGRRKNVSCLVKLNMNEMNSLALNVFAKRRGEMDSRIINSFLLKSAETETFLLLSDWCSVAAT